MDNNNNHLLSIIIPVYNGEKYIRDCIDSVLNQTYNNWELIVINDGSTDGTASIIAEYKNKYDNITIVNKENGGCASGWNKGLELAKGDLIAFVDADDVLDLDMYEVLINILDKNDVDISACSYIRESEYKGKIINKSKQVSIPKEIIFTGKDSLLSMVSQENSIEGYLWNKVWRREVIGNTSFRYDVLIINDSTFTWEVVKRAKKTSYVNLPMYHYRIIASSVTRNSNMESYRKAVYGCRYMLEDAKNVDSRCIPDLAMNYLMWIIIATEKAALASGNRKEDFKYFQDQLKDVSEYYYKISKVSRIKANVISLGYLPSKFFFNILIIAKSIREFYRKMYWSKNVRKQIDG